jgi:hypothetical protein
VTAAIQLCHATSQAPDGRQVACTLMTFSPVPASGPSPGPASGAVGGPGSGSVSAPLEEWQFSGTYSSSWRTHQLEPESFALDRWVCAADVWGRGGGGGLMMLGVTVWTLQG